MTSSDNGESATVSTSSDVESELRLGSHEAEGISTNEVDPVSSSGEVTDDFSAESSLATKDEEVSSSTSTVKPSKPEQEDEPVFLQPMLPPPGAAKALSSSSSLEIQTHGVAGSSSSSKTSSKTGHHGQKPKEGISKEKQEKYNAILASVNYHPPSLGADCADSRYNLEVLKNGMIVDSVRFSADDRKGFYIIGRIPGCEIVAENPTVSRLHAVLQFVQGSPSGEAGGSLDDPRETGLYIYDLKSTHGTFINKNQIFPNKYYRVRVGHVIKFGSSQRMYIVGGPSEDEEEESDKSVTELQNERLQKDLERKRLEEEEQLKRDPHTPRNVEVEGIDWGMGEDADEESDMRINPFAMDYEACELELDNPKKTLRSWFDREGHDLEYEIREKGNGQYVCRIGLPLDGPTDAPVYAESEVKGKKKEAAHDAAMKACQILDSHGLLRTSNQESRKRKEKRYEDEDYYSSDEDTFLDRTGSVEKKREKRLRMAGKAGEKVETYESLCTKYSSLEVEILDLQTKLAKSQSQKANTDDDVDIDEYMKMLKSGVFDVKKLKARLKEANEELQRMKKLMEIAKPAELPSYLQTSTSTSASRSVTSTVVSEDQPSDVSTTDEAPQNSEMDATPKTKSHGKEEELVTKTNDESNIQSAAKSVPDQQLKRPAVGPMKMSLPTNPRQKLYGLIKPSSIPSLKTAVRPPEERPLPTDVDMEEESSDESDEDASHPSKEDEAGETVPEFEKAKRKRQRYRNQKKKQKPNESYDSNDANYSVWVPPTNQTGDGRTSLNEKLGY